MMQSISKHCSECASEFTCGPEQAGQACWCEGYPRILPAVFDQDCRCRTCFARAITEYISKQMQAIGVGEMVKLAHPYFDPNNLIEHIDYTIEDGAYVFSAWYHLKRGTCCGNGCRHCPYQTMGDA